jgi:hypothetical protein
VEDYESQQGQTWQREPIDQGICPIMHSGGQPKPAARKTQNKSRTEGLTQSLTRY